MAGVNLVVLCKIMRDIALFSREIYTAGTNFTQPPVVTVATNLNSGVHFELAYHTTGRHTLLCVDWLTGSAYVGFPEYNLSERSKQ